MAAPPPGSHTNAHRTGELPANGGTLAPASQPRADALVCAERFALLPLTGNLEVDAALPALSQAMQVSIELMS